MLKKGVPFMETRDLVCDNPKGVSEQGGQGREDTKGSSTQPSHSPRDYQRRAADLDKDRQRDDEQSWLQSEVSRFCQGAL